MTAALRDAALRLCQESLPEPGTTRFIYQGRCMSPSLQDGETLIVQPAAPDSLRLGDIVVYRIEGACWVHRFLRCRKKNGALTILSKADNYLYFDRPIQPECLLGKVIAAKGSQGRRSLERRSVRWGARVLGLIALVEGASFALIRRLRNSLFMRLTLHPRLKTAVIALVRVPRTIITPLFNLRS